MTDDQYLTTAALAIVIVNHANEAVDSHNDAMEYGDEYVHGDDVTVSPEMMAMFEAAIREQADAKARIVDLIDDISERCWAASWNSGIERDLTRMLDGGVVTSTTKGRAPEQRIDTICGDLDSAIGIVESRTQTAFNDFRVKLGVFGCEDFEVLNLSYAINAHTVFTTKTAVEPGKGNVEA